MHLAALRKELDDPLFSRTAAGLAFTPGGLRLATRPVEILGLQRQTTIEVTEAAHGRTLLHARAVDIALGPVHGSPADSDASIVVRPFLKYQIIAVASPDNPLAGGVPTPVLLRDQHWTLGPSASSMDGDIATILRNLAIPESRQSIFQSDATALDEVQRAGGVTLTIGFAVAKDLAATHSYQPLAMFPCWLIQACMAIPAATATLMLRVDPN